MGAKVVGGAQEKAEHLSKRVKTSCHKRVKNKRSKFNKSANLLLVGEVVETVSVVRGVTCEGGGGDEGDVVEEGRGASNHLCPSLAVVT